MSELPPLEDSLHALLEAERQAPLREDLPEIKARAREKVLSRIRRGGPGGAQPGRSGVAGAAAAGLVVGLGVGGVLGAALVLSWPRPSRVVYVPVQITVPAPAPAAPLPAVPQPLRTEPVLAPASEPPPEPSGAESALIERSRVALLRGDAQEALVTLMGHERQYPEGALSEERLALVIEALVALGRRDEALVRAAHFRERYPRSVYLTSLGL